MGIFGAYLRRRLWLLIHALTLSAAVNSATAATTINTEDQHALGSCAVNSLQALRRLQEAKQSKKKKKKIVEGEAQEELPQECIPIYVPGLTPGEEAMARACMTYIQEEGSLQVHLQANEGYTLEGTQFWAGLDPRKLPLESDHATPDFASPLFAHHANVGPTADFGYKLPRQASTCSKDEFPVFVSLRTFVGLAKAKGRYQSMLSLKPDRPSYVTKVAVHCTCDTGVQQLQDTEERQRRITSFYDTSSAFSGYKYNTNTGSSYSNSVLDSAGAAETVVSSAGSGNSTANDEDEERHMSSFFMNDTVLEDLEDEDTHMLEENGFNVNHTGQEHEDAHTLEQEYGLYTNGTAQDEDLHMLEEGKGENLHEVLHPLEVGGLSDHSGADTASETDLHLHTLDIGGIPGYSGDGLPESTEDSETVPSDDTDLHVHTLGVGELSDHSITGLPESTEYSETGSPAPTISPEPTSAPSTLYANPAIESIQNNDGFEEDDRDQGLDFPGSVATGGYNSTPGHMHEESYNDIVQGYNMTANDESGHIYSGYGNITGSDDSGSEADESTVYEEAPTVSPTISPAPTKSPSAVLDSFLATSHNEMCLVGESGEYFDGEQICFDLRADHEGTVRAGHVCVELVATTLEVTIKASSEWSLFMNELWVGLDGIDDVPLMAGILDYASFPYFNGDYNGEPAASWSIDLKPYCHDGLNEHQIAMVCHSLIEKLDAHGKPQESSGANVYGFKYDNPDDGAPWFGWFDFTFECECSDGIKGGRLRNLRGKK